VNVWIKLTKKRVPCKHCEKFIETGEYQVVCQYFMKLKNSEKTWTKSMHFHAKDPYCWVDRGITEVSTRPQAERRGRKPDAISDEVKEKRQRILRRRASVMQRIGTEMETTQRVDKLVHLTDLLEQLKVEIEPLGGVPTSWR
jgi:hypothetical protein